MMVEMGFMPYICIIQDLLTLFYIQYINNHKRNINCANKVGFYVLGLHIA